MVFFVTPLLTEPADIIDCMVMEAAWKPLNLPHYQSLLP